MALDVGDSRIGVALSDPLEMLASPLTIIKRLNEASDLQSVANLVNEHKAGKLLVGLPLSLSGETGMQAEKVKAFASRLQAALSIPLEMVDERFSTVTAREYMSETGRKKDRFKKDDAIAAAVILQSYLDEASSRQAKMS
ncbi:MAG: Holliday junction resolvase RuvX [Dehalococcoidia bacterium]|nr:MAG: Holliday junction resolvase RuvX [Dehalococcoidia bacterium]